MSDFLFSYGTLIPQHAPEEIAVATANLVPYAEGWVYGTLYDLGDYPAAVLDSDQGGKIFGTVFLIPSDPDFLRRLDVYEGFEPENAGVSLFVRKRHPVRLSNGQTLDCWLYEYNGRPAHAPILVSGRYQPSKPGLLQ